MRRPAAAPIALVVVGVVVALATGGSTAGTAIALALVGVAAVLAVSLVFFAVGRSEDRERAAAAASRPGAPRGDDGAGAPPQDEQPRPARERRRPLPPRRPG